LRVRLKLTHDHGTVWWSAAGAGLGYISRPVAALSVTSGTRAVPGCDLPRVVKPFSAGVFAPSSSSAA